MTTTSLPDRPATRRRRTTLLVVLAVFAVLAAVLGTVSATMKPAPPGAPPRLVDSVGRVDGSTALVAVLAQGDQVSAYVCDGDTTTGERFSGTLLGDRAVLHSDAGAQLTVDVTDGGATGTFTPAGAIAALPYRTTPSTGQAGWYTAEATAPDGPVAANWVVLADGTQTGVQSNHKHKHRGHRLHVRPGKPSGVSPKPADDAAQPEQALTDVFKGCTEFVGRLCVSGDAAEPVELEDGIVAVVPGRVIRGELPPLSGDPQSIAGA